jgi:hypothetical protein
MRWGLRGIDRPDPSHGKKMRERKMRRPISLLVSS